jgi:hypothetical protein
MSEKHERRENDAYDTPAPLAAFIVRRAAEILGPRAQRLCEPGCGDTAPFSRAALDMGMQAAGCDVRAVGPMAGYPWSAPGQESRWRFEQGDFLGITGPGWMRGDIMATNPPFSLALPFVEQMLERVDPDGVVALLVRAAFLAGLKRQELYARHPPVEAWVCVRRPSFAHGGTENSEYVALFWVGAARHRMLAALGRAQLVVRWITEADLAGGAT